MATTLEQIAEDFFLSKEELIQQSLQAFLLNQLQLLGAERHAILAKFGVNSLEEFNQLIVDRPDEESNLLEDFQRVDYLTYRIKQITKMIEELDASA
jgi:hypothetical protein